MMNTVLVTGCNGYIGSILCKRLHEQGYKVLGFDKVRKIGPNPHVDWFTSSIDDLPMEMIRRHVSKVFHLAAKSVPISESMSHPLRYYDANPGLTARLLNVLIDFGWKGDFVFASSAAVYEEWPDSIKEDGMIDLRPPSHYGSSKLMCEEILGAATVNGIRTVAFRFFNVAGAVDGWGDRNPHILTKIFEAAKSGGTFTINGCDYKTRDGTCNRDYVHVLDVCNAMIVAMRKLEITRDIGLDHPRFSVYNLGTRIGTTNLELAGAATRITKQQFTIKFGPRRVGDVDSLVADPSKFIREYDFVYQYSTIDQIVESAWEYYKNAV